MKVVTGRWAWWAAVAAALGCLPLASCSTKSEADLPAVEHGSLQQGAAARVGGEVVTVQQVRALAEARGLSLEQARSELLYDALMAAGAGARGLDRRDDVVVQRRGVLARALLQQFKREAEERPITDEEVRTFTERNWLDLDRPVARKTTHAVVMPQDPKDEAQAAKADEIAQRIAEAVASATDPEAFRKQAEAVDSEGMKVKVQDLEPVTRDTRVADLKNRPAPGAPPRHYAEAYVEAVFELSEVGDKSEPFRSPFGTHVVMLVSIQQDKRVAFERRRELLGPEIRTHRAKSRMDALVASLKKQTPVDVVRNAGERMQLVPEELTERGP